MKKAIMIILLGFGAAAKAQIPQPDPDTTAKHFLVVASIKNLQEVSAGGLAIKQGTHAEIKSFGQMMIKDHNDAELQLLQLAKRKRIDLSPAATGGIQPDLMLKAAGSKFDELYVHNMVSGHQNTVEVFENYATIGKDPDVKAWAQKMLPSLKHHLSEIKRIDHMLKAGTK